VAFCDVIVERAEKAKEEYGIQEASVYEDYKNLLADESIKVVHVLTPNDSHAEITVAALNAGKHVRRSRYERLRINGESFVKLYTTNVDLNAGGVAFYDGKKESDADLEARLWIDNVINDTEPVVKPEQAFVVTQILEAIYESAKTGKAVYF
jgi:predicted dehydrogenase